MRSTYLEKDGSGRQSSGGTTPMMEQFWRAKKSHPDALLFFRMGDFYELFHEDAKVVARELGLALTARSKGEDAIPMAGVPVRSADSYLMKLVAKGFKVAICEQLQDPRFTKGVVDRGVVRVVTAGTLTEEDALRSREHNYLASLVVSGEQAGIAWVDLSTGRFQVMNVQVASLVDEIARIAPAELLWSSDLRGDASTPIVELRAQLGPRISERDPWRFEREATLRILLAHFRVASLEGFGLEHESPATRAAGALVEYLQETQKSACLHVLRLEHVDPARFLVLDRATSSCLELFRTQRDAKEEGALVSVIDATCTAMGGRRLRDWLAHPLREVEPILHRQRAVSELHGAPFLREELRERLSKMLDVERLAAKVSTQRAHARDLRGLADSLAAVAPIREQLGAAYSALVAELRDRLDPLTDLVEKVRATLSDDPPLALREGGIIRSGVDARLDELRSIMNDGKSWMARFQAEESKRANLPGLKIGFNSVFGYFIEVPKGQVDRVPADYVRKQTIKGGERYITPELKEYEDKVLHAEEKAHDLEYELFVLLREQVAREIPRILETAEAVAILDVLAGLAQRAVENRYVAPTIDDGEVLRIVDGRHPVVERNPRGEPFVPNDSRLNRSDRLITILTGPNMAGKSTYIRQTALIVLLAQLGSFVPAGEARIGIVDRIFTRIGAADDIGRNASTFMVEMLEIANILNNASSRSLVVLDEVGRGTSTFDGLALAWAIVEHLHEKVRARSLFATHYHQLTDLATRLKGVCNMNVAVREWQDEIVFLHKIVDGGTDRSYGIHVARLAGVPREVITRAKEILGDIERDAEDLAPRIARRGGKTKAEPPAERQLGLWEAGRSDVESELAKVDIDALTPIEALLLLRELKQMIR